MRLPWKGRRSRIHHNTSPKSYIPKLRPEILTPNPESPKLPTVPIPPTPNFPCSRLGFGCITHEPEFQAVEACVACWLFLGHGAQKFLWQLYGHQEHGGFRVSSNQKPGIWGSRLRVQDSQRHFIVRGACSAKKRTCTFHTPTRHTVYNPLSTMAKNQVAKGFSSSTRT